MTQIEPTNIQRRSAGLDGSALTSAKARVLYLAHDLDDAAIWRRVRMLEASGAQVEVAGFRRGTGALAGPATLLGRTQDARLLRRVFTVGAASLHLAQSLGAMEKPDVILARNLEMLALAGRARRLWPGPKVRVVYEVLDIHRMMLDQGTKGRMLRQAERRLGANASLVLVSSPGFVRHYFEPYRLLSDRVRVVENKYVGTPAVGPMPSMTRASPLMIGWFGILRCRWSLETLDQLTRANPGRFRVILRGRPALDQIPDFHARVEANPDLHYGGPYHYPDDLPRIYGEVRLVWLADRFDAGCNSDWLLPNRLYEGGAHGRVPIGLEGTEVASFLRQNGLGLIMPRPDAAAAGEILLPLSDETLFALEAAVRAVPSTTWTATADDSLALLDEVLGRETQARGRGWSAESSLPTGLR